MSPKKYSQITAASALPTASHLLFQTLHEAASGMPSPRSLPIHEDTRFC